MLGSSQKIYKPAVNHSSTHSVWESGKFSKLRYRYKCFAMFFQSSPKLHTIAFKDYSTLANMSIANFDHFLKYQIYQFQIRFKIILKSRPKKIFFVLIYMFSSIFRLSKICINVHSLFNSCYFWFYEHLFERHILIYRENCTTLKKYQIFCPAKSKFCVFLHFLQIFEDLKNHNLKKNKNFQKNLTFSFETHW